jgi:acyl-CoA synthetase (AMP-forming)/AMP-acid ligase II
VEPLTFAQVLAHAEAVARQLQERGSQPQDTVALMLPTGRDFYFSFLGILLAGALPVPIYPPVSASYMEEYAERQSDILRNADVRALLTFRQAERLARLLKPQIPSLKIVVRADKLVKEINGKPLAVVDPSPEDIGLIQYTSGSTGNPKGVTLTHANLISNVRAIGEGVGVHSADVVVCWLPLYHDMGLIGCWLFALCHGLPMVSISPLAFLRRPERWLWAMHAYKGTLSPAPNFAFELCVRKVSDDDIEGLDLSHWRVALNGAEPVNPETLERFLQRFSARGFLPGAMMPVYGLAENTVALTFHERNQPPRIDHIEREVFQQKHRAVSMDGLGTRSGASDEHLSFVSVGRAILGHEVRVVNDDGQGVEERVEGNIEFKGPSVTPGYFRNPEATTAIRTEDGWTRTGDLGYCAEGDLFITGRSKELIIKGGRNIYPQEVETVAAGVEGIRAGCVAAFSIPNLKTRGEGLVVVAETREAGTEIQKRLAAEIRKSVATVVKISPDDIRIVSPRAIPKTPSGKLRRAECRRLYLEDALDRGRAPAWVQLVRLSASSAWASIRQGLGFHRGE